MKYKIHLILFSDLSLCGMDNKSMEEERKILESKLGEYQFFSLSQYENCEICKKVLDKLNKKIRWSFGEK